MKYILLILLFASCAQRIRVAVVYADGSKIYKAIGKNRVYLPADSCAKGYAIEKGGKRL